MKKMISIIIPIYNGEKFICRCLDSVIHQKYREIEIIIVNDGSEDSSLKICREYAEKDKRIQVITQENAGVSSARNRAMECADAEWILFLDVDDELPPNTLEIYQKYIVNHPNTDFIAGNIEKISSRKIVQEAFVPLPICDEPGKNYAVNVLYHLSYGTVWGKLFQLDLIKKQELQFDEDLTHGEDCVFVYRYLQFCKNPQTIVNKHTNIYRYYLNEFSVTKKFQEEIPKSYCNALEKIKENMNPKNLEEQQAFYHSCLLHLLLITVNYSFHKNNPHTLYQQMGDYRQLLQNPIFQTALTEWKGQYMGIGKRIVLFMAKTGFYPGIYLCARLRQALR